MKTKRNAIVLLAAAAFGASWTYAALAEPITFTAEGPITGTRGGVAIGGMTGNRPTDVITFTFVSDFAGLASFTVGRFGRQEGNRIEPTLASRSRPRQHPLQMLSCVRSSCF
jgi:hypothetical protein